MVNALDCESSLYEFESRYTPQFMNLNIFAIILSFFLVGCSDQYIEGQYTNQTGHHIERFVKVLDQSRLPPMALNKELYSTSVSRYYFELINTNTIPYTFLENQKLLIQNSSHYTRDELNNF